LTAKCTIVYTSDAAKDAKKLSQAGLQNKTQRLLDILRLDPFSTALPYEKPVGDLIEAYSRRMNIKHRWFIKY
jgi:Txe/YoeB family toxin of toxin-antitoxin system